MMKFVFRIAAVCLFVSASYANAEDSVLYLAEVGHIPLMPGTSVVENSGMVFDKPEGRIAEVTLITDKSPAEFMNYYSESLPPLGWKKNSQYSFTGTGGILTFEPGQKSGKIFISIRLAPSVR